MFERIEIKENNYAQNDNFGTIEMGTEKPNVSNTTKELSEEGLHIKSRRFLECTAVGNPSKRKKTGGTHETVLKFVQLLS